jgi:hypothetical protein
MAEFALETGAFEEPKPSPAARAAWSPETYSSRLPARSALKKSS